MKFFLNNKKQELIVVTVNYTCEIIYFENKPTPNVAFKLINSRQSKGCHDKCLYYLPLAAPLSVVFCISSLML